MGAFWFARTVFRFLFSIPSVSDPLTIGIGFRTCCPGQRQPAEDLEVKRQGHRVSLAVDEHSNELRLRLQAPDQTAQFYACVFVATALSCESPLLVLFPASN